MELIMKNQNKNKKVILGIIISFSFLYLIIMFSSSSTEINTSEEIPVMEVSESTILYKIDDKEINNSIDDSGTYEGIIENSGADSEIDSITNNISPVIVADVANVANVANVAKIESPFISIDKKYRAVALGASDLSERNKVNIVAFGAKGDGITDDTKSIQDAIDFLGDEGGIVYIPKGNYLCNNIKLKSNISIIGDGWNSVLQQKVEEHKFQSLLGINQGGIDTNQPNGNKKLVGSIQNVEIKNLKLQGTVDSEGFSEWVHLLSLNSCSNILVDTVMFEGFRGDGIFIGVESKKERHVSNVTIRNSQFDGINKDNRNGISILDGSDILIENNKFKRISRSDMPGAICIEPNHKNSIEWTIIKDITIKNNYFNDIGTIGIVYYNPNYLSTMLLGPTEGIVIEGNVIDGAYIGIHLTQAYEVMNDSIPKLNINILKNTIKNCFAPIQAQGIRGLNIQENLLQNCNSGLGLGLGGKKVLDVNVVGNSFVKLGHTEDGAGLLINNASSVTITKNTFEDCGVVSKKSKEGFAIIFYGGGSDNMIIEKNSVTSPSNITTHFIYVAPNHKFNSVANKYNDNKTGSFITSKIVKKY